jgi:hypothetical protein
VSQWENRGTSQTEDENSILLPFEIQPPIVQGQETWRGGNWQTNSSPRRYSAGRRSVAQALVISVLRGDTRAAEAARRHGLKVAEVEEWRERFLLGAENALRARPKEEDALRE